MTPSGDTKAEPARNRPGLLGIKRSVWIGVGVAALVLTLALALWFRRATPEPSPDVAQAPEIPAVAAAIEEVKAREIDALREEIARYRQALGSDVCDDDPALPVPGAIDPTQPLLPQPGAPDGTDGPASAPSAPAEQSSSPASGSRSLAQAMERGVVFVITRRSSGSGFFVAPDLVLTNAHVVGTESRVGVTNRIAGRLVQAQVVARTPQEPKPGLPDFALLRLSGPVQGAQVLPLAESLEKLDPIVAAGYPGAVIQDDANYRRFMEGDSSAVPELVLTTGDVSVMQKLAATGLRAIIHTAAVSPGNSGGPLVDRCGRAVGINTFITFATEQHGTISYALTAGDLIEFLRANSVEPQVAGGNC